MNANEKSLWSTYGLAMLFLMGSLSSLGCQQSESASELGDAPYSSKATTAGVVPTDEECVAFGTALENQAAAGNLSAFNDAINWDAILDRAVGGISVDDRMKNGFRQGVLQTVGQPQGLPSQIIQQTEQGGDYKYLGTHMVGDEKRVVFRLRLSGDRGVNYHDMKVLKNEQGQTKAVDIYVLMSAEFMSKTLRRAFIPLAAEQSKSVFQKLTQAENDFVKNVTKFQKMTQLYRSGEFPQVETVYRSLPDSMQQEKNIMLIWLQAASQISDAKYANAIKDFRRYHPNDPCVDIISIDSHILKGQYDEALQCIDRLDESVGGDPYLNVMRANIMLGKGDNASARKFATLAVKEEPTLPPAYWALVSVSLADKNYDETVQQLNLLKTKFALAFDDLTQVPDYADFVKSPQYKDWVKTL